MNLAVWEIVGALGQPLTTGSAVEQIYAVRPHLYRHGSPAGTCAIQIQTTSGTVLATSASMNISAIGSNTYWHGYQRFIISASLAANTTYRFVLITSGYAYSSSAYFGWVNGRDLGKYAPTYAAAGYDYPLDLEVWTRQVIAKGVA
jgi:hypothetical protein